MGMYTYLSQSEREKWVSVEDKDINELLQEVRGTFGNEHLISSRQVVGKRFLRKPITKTLYSIYVGKDVEVQVINFCQEHAWSINSDVTKSYVITYLLGMLTGYAYVMQKQERILSPQN